MAEYNETNGQKHGPAAASLLSRALPSAWPKKERERERLERRKNKPLKEN